MAKGPKFPGGGFGGFGGANLNQLMKQAQKMQADMAKAQEELKDLVVEGTAGGGMVTVKVNGSHFIDSLTINPEAVDPEDVDMLQDMIIAAVNDAMNKLEDASSSKMSGITGGLGNLPFGL